MNRNKAPPPGQASMFDAFDEAGRAQLPERFEEAVPYYRALIARHHAAILAGDMAEAMRINREAHDLAVKLNGGDVAILAGDDAPACVLENATAAPIGDISLWGQTGDFIIEPQPGLRVRIEMDGMFGIGARPIPGFSAHVVDPSKPFISETGYHSFLSDSITMPPSFAVEDTVRETLRMHIRYELKGRLVPLDERYRGPPPDEPGCA